MLVSIQLIKNNLNNKVERLKGINMDKNNNVVTKAVIVKLLKTSYYKTFCMYANYLELEESTQKLRA
jgi:hypothetical protein